MDITHIDVMIMKRYLTVCPSCCVTMNKCVCGYFQWVWVSVLHKSITVRIQIFEKDIKHLDNHNYHDII